MVVVGIDPGTQGGIAYLPIGDPYPSPILSLSLVGLTVEETWGRFEYYKNEERHCFLEKVGYMPGDGGKGAFTFGKVYGVLLGMAAASNMIVHHVPPQVWQAKLGCLTGGDKNVSKKKAQELFPGISCVITHYTADAILLAEYGRRYLNERL